MYHVIYEQNQIISSVKVDVIDNEKQNVAFDYFDFDNSSFEEFIEYLEFMEFDQYIFIGYGECVRIEKIISRLRDKLSFVNFLYIDGTMENNYLKKMLSEKDFNNLLKKIKLLSEINYSQLEYNGFLAYITGLYPSNFKSGLIKHVYLENINTYDLVVERIWEKCAINSCIYIEDQQNILESFLIIKNYKHLYNTIPSEKITKAKLLEVLKNFTQYGTINLEHPIIQNYGHYLNISNLNSLTFSDKCIYLDPHKEFEISSINASYDEIVNKFSLHKSNLPKINLPNNLLYIFISYINVKKFNSDSEIKFVTPFNKNIIASVQKENTELLNWIGFEKEKKYYIYNIKDNRLFNVNQEVIRELEYLIKNEESNNPDTSIQLVRFLKEHA